MIKTNENSPTNTKIRAGWTYYSLIICRKSTKSIDSAKYNILYSAANEGDRVTRDN
jgi:hypothetical protein